MFSPSNERRTGMSIKQMVSMEQEENTSAFAGSSDEDDDDDDDGGGGGGGAYASGCVACTRACVRGFRRWRHCRAHSAARSVSGGLRRF